MARLVAVGSGDGFVGDLVVASDGVAMLMVAEGIVRSRWKVGNRNVEVGKGRCERTAVVEFL